MQPTPSDHLSDADIALRGFSRETDIRLDAEGRFWSGSQPIAHPNVVAAFSRWIERTDEQRYVLRNAIHYVYLDVQGAPLHALNVEVEGEGVTLLLQGGVSEPLRAESLREGPDGVLYASGRDGTWPIRLHPSAVLALQPLLTEGDDGDVALALGGERYRIPSVASPLMTTPGTSPDVPPPSR